MPATSAYPFALPAVKCLQTLLLHPNVTFIIGENGSGKSTLLEAIAVNFGLNAEGGSRNFTFSTQATHSVLHEHLVLTKGTTRPTDAFFLRAESYYNVATNIDDLDKEPGNAPRIINAYGGKSLHEQSHGESFFSLFMHRLRGNGLYILDEPEAALSPKRQMTLLARMHELVGQNSQFIIATHSPILLAYPQAQIFELTETGYSETLYENTRHYTLYKAFLQNPTGSLHRLGIDNDHETT